MNAKAKVTDMVAGDLRVLAIVLEDAERKIEGPYPTINSVVSKLRELAAILQNPETAKF